MARRRFLGPLLFIGICIFGWLLVFDAVAWLLVAHGFKLEMTLYLLAFAAAVLAGLELVSMRVGAAIPDICVEGGDVYNVPPVRVERLQHVGPR